MTKILLAWQDAPKSIDRIRAALPQDAELVTPSRSGEYGPYGIDPRELLRLCHDVEIIMGWQISREAIMNAPRLRMISSPHAGMDLFDIKLLREKGIMLCNARGVNAIPVAEHTLALMLALAKRIPTHDASVKRTDWVEWSPTTASASLSGKTLALLGTGQIGSEVAKRAKGFDMRVIGMRRRVGNKGIADEVRPITALHDTLKEADFIVLALPLTEETRGLIGRPEFSVMKPSAFLINIARGRIVEESSLHWALTENRIAGFAADVWWDYADAVPAGYHYNVPSRNNINKLPNVVGTPNVAANVHGMRDQMIDLGVQNISSYLKGEVPVRMVNLDRGY